jgi:hypothetical protein
MLERRTSLLGEYGLPVPGPGEVAIAAKRIEVARAGGAAADAIKAFLERCAPHRLHRNPRA